jgi:hypothetical protein
VWAAFVALQTSTKRYSISFLPHSTKDISSFPDRLFQVLNALNTKTVHDSLHMPQKWRPGGVKSGSAGAWNPTVDFRTLSSYISSLMQQVATVGQCEGASVVRDVEHCPSAQIKELNCYIYISRRTPGTRLPRRRWKHPFFFLIPNRAMSSDMLVTTNRTTRCRTDSPTLRSERVRIGSFSSAVDIASGYGPDGRVSQLGIPVVTTFLSFPHRPHLFCGQLS